MRSVIIGRCSSSRAHGAAVMRALCDLASAAAIPAETAAAAVEGSVITSFTAVTLVEAIPSAVAAGESHVLPIVELVLKLLSPEVPPQSSATGLLLLAQLTCHSPLSALATSALCSSLVALIAKAPNVAAAESPMLCLLLLIRSQHAAAQPFAPPTNLARAPAAEATAHALTDDEIAASEPALGALLSLSKRCASARHALTQQRFPRQYAFASAAGTT